MVLLRQGLPINREHSRDDLVAGGAALVRGRCRTWSRKNRIADAMDRKAVDPFDATVTGPWLRRWSAGET
jgi:hypothetical protein